MSSFKRAKLETQEDSQNEDEGMYSSLKKLRGSFTYKIDSFTYFFKEYFEEYVLKTFGQLRYPFRYEATDYGIIGLLMYVNPTLDDNNIAICKSKFQEYCIETERRLQEIEGTSSSKFFY
jgi:hypothetical protein